VAHLNSIVLNSAVLGDVAIQIRRCLRLETASRPETQ